MSRRFTTCWILGTAIGLIAVANPVHAQPADEGSPVTLQPPTEAPAPAPETPPPAYDEEAAPAPDAATQPATAFPGPGQPADVDTVLPPESETFNPFKVPEGLTMDAPHLLGILGYGGHPCASSDCFPFTADQCLELAIQCIGAGLYKDAIALADHGLTLKDYQVLYYVRGVAELAAGDCDASAKSARALLSATPSTHLPYVMERLAGPTSGRFRIALNAIGERQR
ncbi:MAG: hypothetical protein ACE37I_18310 [Rubinisphaera brasiliensis]|uniref:hypothetical protein n=1 Tax=Rubinisphaera brasiliensis TaxID=119 RepID=UPI00391DD1A8